MKAFIAAKLALIKAWCSKHLVESMIIATAAVLLLIGLARLL